MLPGCKQEAGQEASRAPSRLKYHGILTSFHHLLKRGSFLLCLSPPSCPGGRGGFLKQQVTVPWPQRQPGGDGARVLAHRAAREGKARHGPGPAGPPRRLLGITLTPGLFGQSASQTRVALFLAAVSDLWGELQHGAAGHQLSPYSSRRAHRPHVDATWGAPNPARGELCREGTKKSSLWGGGSFCGALLSWAGTTSHSPPAPGAGAMTPKGKSWGAEGKGHFSRGHFRLPAGALQQGQPPGGKRGSPTPYPTPQTDRYLPPAPDNSPKLLVNPPKLLDNPPKPTVACPQ